LEYVLDHSDASLVVASPRFAELLRPMAEQAGRRFALTTELLEARPGRLPGIDLQRRAMMLASLEGASDHERLRHLETLMVLAMTAMENFHSFTSECQRLASSLTHAAAERH